MGMEKSINIIVFFAICHARHKRAVEIPPFQSSGARIEALLNLL